MATDPAQVLIVQIADLMRQYLELPGDTPLKATFSEVMPEVEAASGGAAEPVGAPALAGAGAGVGPPPEAPAGEAFAGEEEPVEGGGPIPIEGGGEEQPKTYKEAREGAMATFQEEKEPMKKKRSKERS
jgi:hypothetical protein